MYSDHQASNNNNLVGHYKGGVHPNKKPELYKTEMCRNWNEIGHCRYGRKCRFAHGEHELRMIQRHARYKTEICRTYHRTGTCLYGVRCTFIHDEQRPSPTLPVGVDRGSMQPTSSSSSSSNSSNASDIESSSSYTSSSNASHMTSSVERLESIFDQDAAFYYDTMGTFPLPKKERRLAAFSSICSSTAPSSSNIANNPMASSTSSLGDGNTDLWSLSPSVTQPRQQQQQQSYTSSLSSSPAFRPIHGFYSAPNLAW
ncbi:hypothetical protein O0I10_000870 [Lichtheimia ornata]|uniref:C3H1-type domain-containing protein n=1 Tax=Lichtheimia ornata TaxID=688661 RepID=A0AAD7Y4F4_9FUNG|nr:uncharacterized protein O0I10_000870 [Lichtheimia ornata]KAJ8663624.1 hypothetical protein O0I10_000870 [Lichtheimia ornata]